MSDRTHTKLTIDQVMTAGERAFERGRYAESIEWFEQALARSYPTARKGGEIQLWLVNAYQLMGENQEAIVRCEKLLLHPSPWIKQQAKNLLYILRAPVLQRPKEWMTEIPDLANLSDSERRDRYVPPKTENDRKRAQKPVIEEIDLSQVNTQDNQFVGVAFVLILVILGSVWWLS
jgi:tetratricopeptide (TPR) repeat protein